jgi:hypothetical protein
MAALEIVMIFRTEFFAAALLFAVIFAFGAWRLTLEGNHRPTLWLLAVAFAFELIPLPFYPRVGAEDWIEQGLAGLLSLVGLLMAGWAIAHPLPEVAQRTASESIAAK